jgi:hypothetical protein
MLLSQHRSYSNRFASLRMSLHRDEELEDLSARAERAETKACAAQLEATQAQAALNEVIRTASVLPK